MSFISVKVLPKLFSIIIMLQIILKSEFNQDWSIIFLEKMLIFHPPWKGERKVKEI